MSEEAMDIARRFEQAVNSREVPSGLVSEDCVIENVSTAVTDETYVGREGAVKWMRDLLDAFEEDAVFEQEILRAEDDHLVSLLRFAGRGSHSGAPLELRWASVLWIGGGQIRRAAGYASRREAFAAADAAR